MNKKINSIYKIIINVIFVPFFWLFSYIIPKNKKLILMGSNLGNRFIGNTKYLFLYLSENKIDNFSYYWVTRNKNIYNDLKRKKSPVLYVHSLKAIWSILRANYLVIEQSSQDITGIAFTLGNFNVINLWHGVPIKKFLFDNKADLETGGFAFFMKKEWIRYKYIIAKAKDDISFLKSAFRNNNVVCLGYARDDVLFSDKRYNIQDVDLNSYKTVFLYAPTFRDYYNETIPFSKSFLEKLDNYLKETNSIFLIKKHIADQIADRDLKMYKQYSNIIDITDKVDNLQEFLTSIDILISDYSGVAFDFSLLDKPIIFYPYDYKKYLSDCRKLYYDYYKEMLGPFANNEEELLDLMSTSEEWFSDKKYKEKYKKFKDRFNYYQDDQSAKRLYEFITMLCNK